MSQDLADKVFSSSEARIILPSPNISPVTPSFPKLNGSLSPSETTLNFVKRDISSDTPSFLDPNDTSEKESYIKQLFSDDEESCIGKLFSDDEISPTNIELPPSPSPLVLANEAKINLADAVYI